MSRLGWIDFSSDERDKVKQVLAAINEPGTLDELGVGQIRDAFANRLFPGLSTIQTRAKYFITIARLLRDIQTGKAKKAKSPQLWLEQQEHKLAVQLVDASLESVGELEPGIIGAESIQQGGVSRRPSSIYWNGLKTMGVVHTQLSLKEFCSYLADNSHVAHVANHSHHEGSDDVDVDRMIRLIDLPDFDEHWQVDEQLSIHLAEGEAVFLKEKLMATAAVEDSVPAQILRLGGLKALMHLTEDNEDFELDVLDFDAMAELLLNNTEVSDHCKKQLKQAQGFSLAMEGPHICYNYSLADINGFEALAQQLRVEFTDWCEVVKQRGVFHERCVEDWFAAISGSRINHRSRLFVEQFCEQSPQDASFNNLVTFVERRARDNKGSRCLLNKKRDSQVWAGIRRLDYRWPIARRLLADIDQGLVGGADA